MANMSAAEMLKAEMAGLSPVKPSSSLPPKPIVTQAPPAPSTTLDASRMSTSPADDSDDFPGFGTHSRPSALAPPPVPQQQTRSDTPAESDADADGEVDPDAMSLTGNEGPANGNAEDVDAILAGAKRKFEEGPGTNDEVDDEVVTVEEDDDDEAIAERKRLALKVNADGTVEQEDIVK
ncbi:hypothetical protein BDQ12DRAFT_170351 [Crucibulum laeve]|uniref:Uncharacterized protein n=1 Tax=Crucibulum laeve TaxID=68775 RepID=A0A5C3MH28_9AGAR|nr:hypothetical protein BDQ12DRAFT_170351 [Crucibulum laeve]